MNKWKRIGIIFIILFVVETIIFITMVKLGLDIVNTEERCSNECIIKDWTIAYYYDAVNEICYCLDIEGEYIPIYYEK